jgi:hypothetical protein
MISLADLFPLPPEQRPENRRRREETAPVPAWDAARSEAFFEDLDLLPALQPQGGPGMPLAA